MNLGQPGYAFDYDEVSLIVGRMWSCYQPGTILLNSWDSIICKGKNQYVAEMGITKLTAYNEKERLARDREFWDWLKPRLERNFGFRTLCRHYAHLGIEGGYSDFGNYTGLGYSWSFIIKTEHLPSLEYLAQTEAGFVTNETRAAAARDFRTYIKRHYDANWEENRKHLPLIDESPYNIWLT